MNNNKAILCLGSNVKDAEALITAALCKLSAAGCEVLRDSDYYQTSSAYINYVVEVSLKQSLSWLLVITKNIEAMLGRKPELKPMGIVPIDVDIVMFNGYIVRPHDFTSDYFMTGYLRLG